MTAVVARQAPCADIEPDIFFPPTYGITSGRLVALAKSLCSNCATRAACLAGALARDEQFGIWGGTTPAERARLRAQAR